MEHISEAMKKISLFLLATVALCACNDISYDERLVEEQNTNPDTLIVDALRYTLIEDFTGQNCPNCPTATAFIESLEEIYGDQLVCVGIHSGMLGMGTPLFTQEGQHFFSLLGNASLPQPAVRVNRQGSPLSGAPEVTNKLPGIVQELNHKVSSIVINNYEAQPSAADSTAYDIKFKLGTMYEVEGAVQVWVTQDSISSWQKMPDGSRNRAYNHMSVFRKSLSALDGDTIAVALTAPVEKSYKLTLASDWVPQNMNIVVIVTSKSGEFLQVRKFPLLKKK